MAGLPAAQGDTKCTNDDAQNDAAAAADDY
jgi:hypothetical protein